jgi:hypothetical protein
MNVFCKIKVQRIAKSLCSDLQWGFTWRRSHDNLFGFAKTVESGAWLKNHGYRGSMSSP